MRESGSLALQTGREGDAGQPQVAGAGVSHIVWQKKLGFLNRFCVVEAAGLLRLVTVTKAQTWP